MDAIELLTDLHKHARRQGPGGDRETGLALDLCQLNRDLPMRIADIGCGTGASTLFLARNLPRAKITAVDFLEPFLEVLSKRAAQAGVTDRVSVEACAMERLPFQDGKLDLIWSEGAIYNMGFREGVTAWKRFLKPGGLLAVSEITWITGSRPQELQAYWDREYPQTDIASAKMADLEATGYSPVGYFALPGHCWTDNYYKPLREGFEPFLKRNGNSERARAIVEAEEAEIQLYEKFKPYYSYGFYIAKNSRP